MVFSFIGFLSSNDGTKTTYWHQTCHPGNQCDFFPYFSQQSSSLLRFPVWLWNVDTLRSSTSSLMQLMAYSVTPNLFWLWIFLSGEYFGCVADWYRNINQPSLSFQSETPATPRGFCVQGMRSLMCTSSHIRVSPMWTTRNVFGSCFFFVFWISHHCFILVLMFNIPSNVHLTNIKYIYLLCCYFWHTYKKLNLKESRHCELLHCKKRSHTAI